MQLAERLVRDGHEFAMAWNFGPAKASESPVSHITNRLVSLWGHGARWEADGGEHPHEASYLKLDCSKAEALLGWRPLLDLEQALALTVEWYRTAAEGGDLRALSLKQLDSLLPKQTSRAT